jgi:hypothetical protein
VSDATNNVTPQPPRAKRYDPLRAVVLYAELLRWAGFPCGHRSKTPACPHGVHEATRDVATLRALFGALPDANVAIATGSPSGIVVVDVDSEQGEAELRALGGWAEPTLCCTTAKGRHVYFTAPAEPLRSRVRFRPGLDARGDGTYVLVPPSLHPTGHRYVWENWGTPVLPLPPALLAALRGATGALRPLPTQIPEGERNSHLFRFACALRRYGASEAGILAALEAENSRCVPTPLALRELLRIARSSVRYMPVAGPGSCAPEEDCRRALAQFAARRTPARRAP